MRKKRTTARGRVPAGHPFLSAMLMLVLSFAVVLASGGVGERDGATDLRGGAGEAVAGAEGLSALGAASPPAAGVVDSVFPIEEEIRRFRVGLPEVTELSGGASTLDTLVDRFVRAIESADTAALGPLLLDRSEFGYLYYPHTMYTAPPYELSPALLWFQMQNLTDSGLARVFRRAAEGPLHVAGYRCEETPKIEGPNRVWSECSVILQQPGREPVEMQLFGSVVERGGVHKFVSYATAL